ncbi:hypothetical protein MTR_3g090920 [Medicago truncatula]|uniref:RNase H type-1 domain-containing protein n=1 Tax=Medicago truncatula TaxID=3880 RepID=G7J6R9_MEDTR|nr:hypothetical protein MTR_3g090920 [Medicago truncatula]
MFMGAKTIWLQPIMSIDKGEALELLAAMKWVRELEFKKIIVYDAELGSILARCRVNLSDIRNNSYVDFSKRDANMIAHNLAKATIYNDNSHLYFDIYDCIIPLNFNEMN